MLETITHQDERTTTFAERVEYENEIQSFNASANTQAMHILTQGPLTLYLVRKKKEAHLSSFNSGVMESRTNLDRHIKTAQLTYDYYCQQLELFCCMARCVVSIHTHHTFISDDSKLTLSHCRGRNYVAIGRIRKFMKFDIVLSGMLDTSLPSRLRGLFTKLMNCIYVNVEPFFKLHLPVLTREQPGFKVEDSYFEVASECFEDARQSQQQLAESKNKEADAYRTRDNFALLQAFVSVSHKQYVQSIHSY